MPMVRICSRDVTASATASGIPSSSGHDLRILRGEFHRHSEISFDGGHDGTIIDQLRYIIDVGSLDWFGCCDHSNGGGREYSWWTAQKLTDIFHSPGTFSPLFSYERSIDYRKGAAMLCLQNEASARFPDFRSARMTRWSMHRTHRILTPT